MLLDEPFSAVDEKTIEDLMNVLFELHNDGATIVTVVHNIELVRKYFPLTMLLSRELIGFGKTKEVITTENLARASSIGFGDVNADICEVSDHA
jgi:zinc/manganese transport system ATP-binding protein